MCCFPRARGMTTELGVRRNKWDEVAKALWGEL